MKGFDVLKVKSAVKTHNRFDLSRTHLTTMDFGQIVPLFAEETVPGDKFNISADFFSRMAPLVKPTYGKFSFKTVTAFVPYHQIAVDSDAWFAGKKVWEGQTPHQRYFTFGDLADFLRNYCVTTTDATSANTEWTYIDTAGVTVYNLLTPIGKYYVKVLNALGYSIPQGVDLQTSSTWKTSVAGTVLSAYPLLAFVKLYNDYMSQSTRFNTSSLSSILFAIKYGDNPGSAAGIWNPSTGQLYYSAIYNLLKDIVLAYGNDYFTSAWQCANNPLTGQESIDTVSIPSPVTNGIAVVKSSDADQSMSRTGSAALYSVSQRALDFLKRFDDWVRRNNYSGSRSVQQIYSRFGIKTDDYKSHYANVYDTDVIPVQVGDVTATADATNVPLGDYAGKGIMNGGKSISIEVSDYGMIFILGYFTVVPMNSFGFDRKVLRSNPLDYYNPEFDGVGADAISVGELWASPIESDNVADNAVFGYTERYNAYRYGRDVISGEFRNYHADGDMNTWHTGRNLAAVRAAGNLVAQSTSMNTMAPTDSEYNRIFSITDDSVDHFYMTARFNVSAIRPMLNLNQVVDLGEGDTTVPRNGNVIS